MLNSIRRAASQLGKAAAAIFVGTLMLLQAQLSLAQNNQAMADPLDSPMWQEMHQRLLDGLPVVFDDRVKVIAPGSAEDSMNVPVKVDASAIGEVNASRTLPVRSTRAITGSESVCLAGSFPQAAQGGENI